MSNNYINYLSLTRHKYYKIRFRIDKKLVPYFNRKEITKSLNTKDKQEAELQLHYINYHYSKIKEVMSILSSEQIQFIVDEFIENILEQSIIKQSKSLQNPYKHYTSLQSSYDKYTTWYKQQNITKKQYMATTNKLIKLIIPFFGANTNIDNITLESVEEFKEFLSTFPNISLLPYKHMKFEQLIKLKNVPSDKMISTNTQIKYLKILKQFFNYLIKANIIQYNPCQLLTMPKSEVINWQPYTIEEMKELHQILETLDDKKYIFYCLMYSGMRPSELWNATISQDEQGIVYFDLTDKQLQLKTLSSYRKVPLHNMLLDFDIQSKLEYLQTSFTQVQISLYFHKEIKPLITEDKHKIMYSFRHTVATTLKHSNIEMDKISEILGHSYESSSITKEVYAKSFALDQLQLALNSLKYL